MVDPSLFFFFGLLVVVAVFAYAVVAGRKRRQALEAIAQRLGLAFEAGSRPLDADLRAFEAMSTGRDRRIVNELRGEHKGHVVRCFDHRYTVKQGKHDATHTRGVVLVAVPRAWPAVRIVPEHIGHKLFDALGGDDIDFESQEFSDRFWVRSDDRRFAYDLLHPRAMQFLLDAPLKRWEMRDGWLCVWRESTWRADEVEDVLDQAAAFLALVPPHLEAPA